jgi:phytoene dehydrogenase-like protein
MKINIIGAGAAGLSAGCYLQMNGFSTTIFESQPACGGLCTSWRRNGYTFESGLQWLLGSGKSNPFYGLWSELIDMDSIRFVNHEFRMAIEVKENRSVSGDKVFYLYNDLDRLEKYLLAIAPEDKKLISRLIHTMRRMQQYEIPPMIKSVPALLPWYRKIRYIRYLTLLLFLHSLKRETNFTFAGKLKNPFLKEAFMLLFDGDEMPLLIVTMPLAFSDLLAAGYPIGGSACFIGRLEQKFLSLGGTLRYGSDVERIVVKKGKAEGIQLKTGEFIPSGITISAADWNFTVFGALEGKYVNKTILKLHRQEMLRIYDAVFLVSLGVSATLKDQPHFLRFPLPCPLISPDGTRYERMEIHINNYDPTAAPEGNAVVSISYYTRNGDYWINLRQADIETYRNEKLKFSGLIIEQACTRIPGLKDNIREVDVATPATFQRYTNNWKGSVQGWFPGKNIIAPSPVHSRLPGLDGFYFIGHWTMPGGGLPVAIKSARDVARMICHREKIRFSITPSG